MSSAVNDPAPATLPSADLRSKRGLVVCIAAELGPKGIRAHTISPGPISTRAASGIDRFDELIERAAAQAPEHHLVDLGDVGALQARLWTVRELHLAWVVSFRSGVGEPHPRPPARVR